MATILEGGPIWGTGSIDAEGHRMWPVYFRTRGDRLDGPATHIQTPGLPNIGSIYAVGNDLDIWAWCRSGPTSITPEGKKGGVETFLVGFTFSTQPAGNHPGSGNKGKDDKGSRKKCADARIEDPLSEPPSRKVSTVRYQKEEEYDKDGEPFLYSSFEPILGQFREFDAHREQVIIEANVVDMDLSLLKQLRNKLNDADMWGLPARCWKLVEWSGDSKLYGTCSFYWTRRLVLESWAEEVPITSPLFVHPVLSQWIVAGPDGKFYLPGWDKYVLDESYKVLNGHWHWLNGSWVLDNINGAVPDPLNPAHYIVAKDRQHNPTRLVLDRRAGKTGQPISAQSQANYIRMAKYNEANLFQLNVPVNL